MQVLYKYQAPNEYALPMLRRGTLWFALPESFNDPHDCKATILGKATQEEGARFVMQSRVAISMIVLRRGLQQGKHPFGLDKKSAKKVLREFEQAKSLEAAHAVFQRLYDALPVSFPLFDPSELVEQIESALERIGVLSLSERCDHMLMWAHYTDNHRGFCLGFERAATNELGDERFCKPVRYVSEFPQLDVDAVNFRRTISPEIGVGHAENTVDLTDTNLQNVVFSKGTAWSYEQEWRLIVAQGGEERPYPGPLREVIFGLRCDNDRRRMIADAVTEAAPSTEVAFKEVATKQDSHILEVRPVEI